MPLPRYSPSNVDSLQEVIRSLYQLPSLDIAIWHLSGLTNQSLDLRTEVPYLILPLRNETVCATDNNGKSHFFTFGKGIYWKSGSQTSLVTHDIGTHLRITWDTDYTFVGITRAATHGPQPISTDGIVLAGPPSALAHHLHERLCAESTEMHQVSAFVHALLADVDQALGLYSDENPVSRNPERWRDIVDYIERNACRPRLDRNRVAEAFAIHPNHLSRLLRKHSQQNFSLILTEARLRNVERLLCESHLDLASIAQNCGFSSASQLVRAFKRKHQTTPAQWRAAMERPPQRTP